jgi:hypothetical protein
LDQAGFPLYFSSNYALPLPNREAAYISLGKYGKDAPLLATSEMMVALDWATQEFLPVMGESRIKTFPEVLQKVDLSTSPGIPWIHTGTSTKADFLAAHGDEFFKFCDQVWDELPNGWTFIYNNSLKEEVRLVEKIDANSIRTFVAGPFESTMVGNRLFEDMNEKLCSHPLFSASAVGMSSFGGGWDELVRKMRRFSKTYEADESQYDSSLNAMFLWWVMHLRWAMLSVEWKTEENWRRFVTYYTNLIFTVIMTPDGYLVRKTTGNPSGSVNTITDNTMILFLIFVLCWRRAVPAEYDSYKQFKKHLILALFGDDNLFSVSTEADKFFNVRVFIEQAARLGITVTTPCTHARSAEECSFLSTESVLDNGLYLPQFESDKLLASLRFSDNAQDPCLTLQRLAAYTFLFETQPEWQGKTRAAAMRHIELYDPVLKNQPAWLSAKASLLTPSRIYEVWRGKGGGLKL